MPKLVAPHRAVWRGRVLDADGTIEVPDEAVAELAAHGFREAATEEPSDPDARVAAMSRRELIAFIRENGGGNAVTLSNDALRHAARKIITGL